MTANVSDSTVELREWLTEFQSRVRAVDFEGARKLCAHDMVAFGTVAGVVEGIDRVIERQWKQVWPNIRDFTIRLDSLRGRISGDHAWVAALWESLGVRGDGTTFERGGRFTVVLERRDGRWLATHTHVSLSPAQ